jgi:hypothetical protein
MHKFVCKECFQKSEAEEGDDNFGTDLCCWCFEDGVERADESRRERIALANEY